MAAAAGALFVLIDPLNPESDRYQPLWGAPPQVAARAVSFLAIMCAIGLFVLRIAIARPVVRRVEGTSLRGVSVAFFVAAAVSIIVVVGHRPAERRL